MIDNYTQSIYHEDSAAPDETTSEPSPSTGHIIVRKNSDGTETHTVNGIEHNIGNPEKAAAEKRLHESGAQARLSALRARRGSLIVPLDVEEETWFLLEMDMFRINEVGVRVGATQNGFSAAHNNEIFTGLIMATLQVGVVKAANDPTPYFNPEPFLQEDEFGKMAEKTELELLCAEPGFAMTVATLFDKLTDLNPKLWSQKKSVTERIPSDQPTSLPSGSTDASAGLSSPPHDSEN